MVLQHDVHAAPSTFFEKSPEKFLLWGQQILKFDLQNEIDSFSESLKVNPFKNPEQDVWYVVGYLLLWTVLHLALQRYVWTPLANRFLPVEQAHTNGQTTSNSASDTKKPTANSKNLPRPKPSAAMVHKFVTAGWKVFAYGSLFVSGLVLLVQQPWWHSTWMWWHSWPQMMEPSIRQFFCFYLAFYLHETAVLFYEPPMKDRPQMVLHHIATMSLILLSYFQGHYRIALPIMILHDFSDPFMEIAKLFNYCHTTLFGYTLADVFFVLFMLAFFYTRLYLFPFVIIETALFEATEVCTYCNGLYVWLLFFSVLLMLHIYWSFLILKILWSAIVHNGVTGDVREEDD